MKKKNYLFFGLIIMVTAASLLALGSPAHTPVRENNMPTCCKQSMKDCAGKTNSNAPGEIIMESLSRQFLSLTAPAY